ncbi:hypothetical protein CDAR_616541 [Caerostris darwini]|uniref:Uncharacterized protein n=1 Tax=Caerostris darwini TaxID=1538125 RepID=A0AAV4VTP4_9ARAC|nr:hypothetical protein CDAR_616541 [Caerostris darwini]
MQLQQKEGKILQLLESLRYKDRFGVHPSRMLQQVAPSKQLGCPEKRMRHAEADSSGAHDCPRNNPSALSTVIPIYQVTSGGEESEQIKHFRGEHT